MNIQVVYTTQLKAALERANEIVAVPSDTTIAGLLEHLAAQHGSTFSRLVLDEQDHPLPSILLCVGDNQVKFGDPAPLTDGAEVTILSAISGG